MTATDKAVIRRHVLTASAGVLVAAGSVLLGQLPIRDAQVRDALSTYVIMPGYLLAAVILAGVVARNRWYFSPRARLDRTLGKDGWLTRYDLRSTAGAAALYRQAGHLRPDLPLRPDGSRKQPITAYGTCVGRVVSGSWWIRGRRVYSPHSRGVLVLGPQGSGKSSWLVHQILDFPGAAYVTSTKPELAVMTARARSIQGPVHVFNPAGLGDLAGTFAWDPVAGCVEQAVADRRAWALVRGGGGAAGIDRADFWAQKAQEIIRAYLLAAALVGYDMGAVHYWATNPDDRAPVGILQAHPDQVPAGWVGTLQSSLAASPNTRTGYVATVTSCVGFMDNPRVASACRPRPSDHFDVGEFLRRGGTLYAVAGEDPRLAPLLTALTEHVFSQAKLEAAAHPGGRLPDGLAMILDEVAQQTPVPLDTWAADSRGWGITVTAVVQDLAQLRTTWGPDRAQTIYANLPAKVVLPGVANKDDLEKLAYLAGRRKVPHVTEGHSIQAGGMLSQRSLNRSHHLVDEQVVGGEAIYGLPRWHAYVLGLAPRAVVVRYEPGYVRAQRINGRARR